MLIAELATEEPQAKGLLLVPQKPMAATRAVELAKSFQRPVTES